MSNSEEPIEQSFSMSLNSAYSLGGQTIQVPSVSKIKEIVVKISQECNLSANKT